MASSGISIHQRTGDEIRVEVHGYVTLPGAYAKVELDGASLVLHCTDAEEIVTMGEELARQARELIERCNRLDREQEQARILDAFMTEPCR